VLTRQKTILALLSQAGRPFSPTVFVKLIFLLRHETMLNKDTTFYDFVPYKYGPFSFALYRELATLRRNGYVTPDEEGVALSEQNITISQEKAAELPAAVRGAVGEILSRYGRKSQAALLDDVYCRYPWYATRSERADLRPKSSTCSEPPARAVYTAGYEGKSIDLFFCCLLKQGIQLIIDVRATPLSRRYGFSKRGLSDIGKRLGIDYRHTPALGIPGKYRSGLTDYDSYQRLLDRYERKMLPKLENEICAVSDLMQQTPAVLLCLEKDARCCHRSRLAVAISRKSGMEVVHL